MDKGLQNELTGEAYAVIDGTDGRAHHVRFRGVRARAADRGHRRGPPLRRAGGRAADTRTRQSLGPRPESPDHGTGRDLARSSAGRTPTPLAMGGFGREVRAAMSARADHLAEEGLARRQGQRLILQRDLLNTLTRRELDAVAARLSTETGLPHMKAPAGEHVAGVYRQRLTLASGRFAMIDNGLGFQLVPWSPPLEKKLGQSIAGIAKDGGGIEWSFGRKRGLGL